MTSKEVNKLLRLRKAARAYLRDIDWQEDELSVFNETITIQGFDSTIFFLADKYGKEKGWDKTSINNLYDHYITTIYDIANIRD